MWSLICCIAGIVIVCMGKFQLTRQRVVLGWRARILGVLLLLPLPITLVVGFAVGFASGMRGEMQLSKSTENMLTFVELGILALFAGCAFLLGFVWGEPEPERPWRRRGRRDDEADDERAPAERVYGEPGASATGGLASTAPSSPRPLLRDDDRTSPAFQDAEWERRPAAAAPTAFDASKEKLASPPAPMPAAPLHIELSCTQCGTRLRVKGELAGKKCRCGKCQTVLDVPVPVAPVVEAVELAAAVTTLPAAPMPPSKPGSSNRPAANGPPPLPDEVRPNGSRPRRAFDDDRGPRPPRYDARERRSGVPLYAWLIPTLVGVIGVVIVVVIVAMQAEDPAPPIAFNPPLVAQPWPPPGPQNQQVPDKVLWDERILPPGGPPPEDRLPGKIVEPKKEDKVEDPNPGVPKTQTPQVKQPLEGPRPAPVPLVDRPIPKSVAVANRPAWSPVADPPLVANTLLVKNAVRDLVWHPRGDSFYVLTESGSLRQFAQDGLKEVRRLNTDCPCAGLNMSAEGLVLTLKNMQEFWLVDPLTLEVKRRMGAKASRLVAAASLSSYAYAVHGDGPFGGGVTVFDLRTGEALREVKAGGSHPMVSPNGKYLFLQTGIEQLARFRLDGDRVIAEEHSPRIAQNGQSICVSPDSKFVCLPSGGGNYSIPGFDRQGYATFIFAVDNLQTPRFVLESGAYPRAVGFDPKAGFIYAQNADKPLLVFNFNGNKKREFSLGIPRAISDEPRQFAVHPEGHQVLVLTGTKVIHVQLPRDGNLAANIAPPAKITPPPGNEPRPPDAPMPLPGGKTLDDFVGKSLALAEETKGGLKVTPLRFPVTSGFMTPPVWNKDGSAFFVGTGLSSQFIFRVRAKDFILERHTRVIRSRNQVELSATGLVVRLEGDELLVLDEATLEVKKRLTAPPALTSSAVRWHCSPGSKIAVAMQPKQSALVLLDLEKGQSDTVSLAALGLAGARPVVRSLDGQYLYVANGSGRITRLRLESMAVKEDESVQIGTALTPKLSLSPDGQFLGVSAISLAQKTNSVSQVLQARQLSQPAVQLERLLAIGFEPNGRWYGADEKNVYLFSRDGSKQATYPMADVYARFMAPSPAGGGFLAPGSTSTSLRYFVHLPVDK